MDTTKDWIFILRKRIKHNDLLPWFLEDHGQLPSSYLKSTKKFFDSICWPRYYGGGPDLNGKIFRLKKPQAASGKLKAASVKLSPQLNDKQN